jgi:hypothetical protein
MKYSEIDLTSPDWAEICYKFVEQEDITNDFYNTSCYEDISILEYCLKHKREVVEFALDFGLFWGSVEFNE